MTNRSWSIDPDVFGDVVEEDLAKLRTTISLDAHRNIVLRTPVLTGRARGSWAISYGVEVAQDLIAKTTGEAISKGYQQILSKATQPYEKVVISNNLPYAGKLENGSSEQAPNGMVAVTMVGINAKYK